MFEALKPGQPDPLLALIAAHAADRRADKVDLGVGVYRDAEGRTPVMRAVKAAEHRLAETQETKAYLGPAGNAAFLDAMADLTFGVARPSPERMGALQTPGGTAALRMAAEVVRIADPAARVWLLEPTWPNHPPIFAAAGLSIERIAYAPAPGARPDVAAILDELRDARPGDVVVLQGACHNPTGQDLTGEDWAALAAFLNRRCLVPLIDQAYQGLGDGLDADAAGLRYLAGRVPEMLVTVSCSKNFGLYRERTGGVFVLSEGDGAANAAAAVAREARGMYSMPPDHGAALVAEILNDPDLARTWREELETMRVRLADLRKALAASHPALEPAGTGRGMFALLPINPDGVEALRTRHGIYMPGNGRINIGGLRQETLWQVAEHLGAACLPTRSAA
ncbi:amino acid aminotransferase [Tranquillimonas alkanivorans]|uniref:Aromatic-amino-acid transaminase n=1 Tax=Tranquillimonas alkanivorans TaxID=441119 RepID=A0A1I5S6T0_9RHOB|nr:aromatic amino acid transaminase [Tranquillimonas alkanivorans]SFP66337.1 aromatic-amino-acid transaminase [Tranquillimonas alkanivorans]